MKIFEKKWVKVGLLAAAILLAAIWLFGFVLLKYEDSQRLKEIKARAEKFEQLQKMVEKDTYGGETPQETLQMFIDAVEAGDYGLASKYFVVEKQEKELNDLRDAPIENIKNVMSLLKKVVQRLEDKKLSGNETNFVITDPILVLFIKYPSNVWKINEI